ncbi:hypothetical protein [Luteimonas sp. MC1750]|uniref:hypothetical protein n=1 Tax=Luteimonas sp. MC1750 TaxID=2799326 RepID=UPI0018F0D7A7|nr:hypothetical protein [Luteimonas sp. MC1750]MBJ6984017.1 hypothetical protein [Luteimonas sp. MC1750]QQO06829.1 hypothetical protein JGR68_05225 [Luteimonas sp. MC1750]
MSLKERLYIDEFLEAYGDIGSETWSDESVFFLLMVIVVVSALASVITILSRKAGGRYGWMLIWTPIIFLFASNVFEHVADSVLPSLYIATVITIAYHVIMVRRAIR